MPPECQPGDRIRLIFTADSHTCAFYRSAGHHPRQVGRRWPPSRAHSRNRPLRSTAQRLRTFRFVMTAALSPVVFPDLEQFVEISNPQMVRASDPSSGGYTQTPRPCPMTFYGPPERVRAAFQCAATPGRLDRTRTSPAGRFAQRLVDVAGLVIGFGLGGDDGGEGTGEFAEGCAVTIVVDADRLSVVINADGASTSWVSGQDD